MVGMSGHTGIKYPLTTLNCTLSCVLQKRTIVKFPNWIHRFIFGSKFDRSSIYEIDNTVEFIQICDYFTTVFSLVISEQSLFQIIGTRQRKPIRKVLLLWKFQDIFS